MANSRAMVRVWVVVNNPLMQILISELTTSDVCAVTIDVSVGNLGWLQLSDAFKRVVKHCVP